MLLLRKPNSIYRNLSPVAISLPSLSPKLNVYTFRGLGGGGGGGGEVGGGRVAL